MKLNWFKIIKYGSGSLLTMAIVSYMLLFSKAGNWVMSSYVESLLNSDPKVPIKVEEFTMDTEKMNLRITIADLIDTKLDGKMSLFGGGSFEGNYVMDIDDLSRINIAELKNIGAKGSFSTNGTITKADDGYHIKGYSGMYGGDLNYDVVAEGKDIKNINFIFDNLKLSNMLIESGKDAIAEADIVIKGDIKDATEGNLDGFINTTVKNGSMNNAIMIANYGNKMPDGFTFSVDIDTKLDKTKAISVIDMTNTFLTLTSAEFIVDLESEELEGDYKLVISELSKLGLSKEIKVAGKLSTTGTVSGTYSDTLIKGVSDLYDSDTTYTMTLKKGELRTVDMAMPGISLKKIAEQNGQKSAMDGKLNVMIDIDDAREGKLDGLITSQLTDMMMDKEVLAKQYDMQMDNNLTLKATNHVKLVKDTAIINSKITTDLATLDVNDLLYSIKDKTSKGTYQLKSADFSKLAKLGSMTDMLPASFVDNTAGFNMTGNIKGGTSPYIDGKSDFLDGEINFVYENDKVSLNLLDAGLDVKKEGKVTYSSNANGTFNYDTNKETVDMLFTLAQGDTLLDVKKANLDMKNETVDALFKFSGYGKKIDYSIKGDLNDPDITIKADKPLISKPYLRYMKKEIEANLKDEKQKSDLYRLLALLSKPNAQLNKKDMIGIEKSVISMVTSLKKEYAKFENVDFTKEHLDDLQALSEKFRKEKGILSADDIKEVEQRSKNIVKAIETEWDSDINKKQRKQTLSFFNDIGKKISQKGFIDKSQMDKQKLKLSNILDAYQRIISDKSKVDNELKKYDAIIKLVRFFKKDETLDKNKVYAMIGNFNDLLGFLQKKIVSIDTTDEQIRIVNDIATAIKKFPPDANLTTMD